MIYWGNFRFIFLIHTFVRKHNETLDVFMILISNSLCKYLVIKTYTKYCTVKSVATYSIYFGINRKNEKIAKMVLSFILFHLIKNSLDCTVLCLIFSLVVYIFEEKCLLHIIYLTLKPDAVINKLLRKINQFSLWFLSLLVSDSSGINIALTHVNNTGN